MSLTVLGGLIGRGLAVGAAWGFFVAGVILGFFVGAWCALFENCDGMAPLQLLLVAGVLGALIGAAGGLLVGSIAAVVISVELAINESWLHWHHFPLLAALQVAIPCALFLPPTWGGGLAFSAPWDALFQIMVFKLIPAALAGYFTWRYLKGLQLKPSDSAWPRPIRSDAISSQGDI